MTHQLTSMKRAHAIFAVLLLLGIAALSYTGQWWPFIMLVIGVPLALKQFLLGKIYDMVLTLAIFGGTFATVEYNIALDTAFIPVICIVAALYILLREFVAKEPITEEEKEEDLLQEMEEEKKK
jgi:hypothetical protein